MRMQMLGSQLLPELCTFVTSILVQLYMKELHTNQMRYWEKEFQGKKPMPIAMLFDEEEQEAYPLLKQVEVKFLFMDRIASPATFGDSYWIPVMRFRMDVTPLNMTFNNIRKMRVARNIAGRSAQKMEALLGRKAEMALHIKYNNETKSFIYSGDWEGWTQ